jgi:hypothetical protein
LNRQLKANTGNPPAPNHTKTLHKKMNHKSTISCCSHM